MVARSVCKRAFRPRLTTSGATVAVLLALFALSCSGGADPVEEPPQDPIAALERAPVDEAAWVAALNLARRENRLAELRSAVQGIAAAHPDRWEPVWLEAECVLWQGGRVVTAAHTSESRPLFERALLLAEKADRPAGVARIARQLAFGLKLEGQTLPAHDSLKRAVEAAGAAGRDDLLAAAEKDRSILELQFQLEQDPASDATWYPVINHCKREGTLAQLGVLADEIAAAHPDLWHTHYARGEETLYLEGPGPSPERVERAKVPLRRALELAREADDPIGIARASNRLAFCAKYQVDSDEAERLYLQGLSAAERAGNRSLEAFISNNLGGLYLRTGRYVPAIAIMERAAEALRDEGMPDRARQLSYNRTILLAAIGNHIEAKEQLLRLHAEALAEGQDLADTVSVALGNLHGDLRDTAAARDWFGRVSADNPRQSIRAQFGLGRIALDAGELDEAARRFAAAANQEEDLGLVLISRTFEAEVALRQGRVVDARERVGSIIDEADSTAWAAWKARTIYGKTLLGRDGGRDEALRQFREAMEIVDERSTGLDPQTAGMGYLRRGRTEPFIEYAAALAELDGAGRAAEILHVVERAHARALRQMLNDDGAIDSGKADAATIRRTLRDGEVLVDYLIGNDRGVVVAVTADAIVARVVPGWHELRPSLKRYAAALRRPLLSAEAREDPRADFARDADVGVELYRKLLGPVEQLLDGATRLYVIPDQDLALLPFGALVVSADAGRPVFLAASIETAVLPLAGSPPRWGDARTPVLLAGDPVGGAGAEVVPLPHAAAELQRLGEVWGASQTTSLVRDELSLERIDELALRSFRTLHFATHAVASSTDPRRCTVILSAGDRLAMPRIAELRLGPALVVLSACSTGEGEVIPGEGVVGLSWAFLRAGARGIAASLWSVDDSSTAELMVAFHDRLRAGDDPVRSMALAQRAVAESRWHPVYWAPFVVILSPT
ncbi:MAG: CHAT domain-containing protein [bacterium]|nr:CHAT domain-containing protein [bacterium]